MHTRWSAVWRAAVWGAVKGAARGAARGAAVWDAARGAAACRIVDVGAPVSGRAEGDRLVYAHLVEGQAGC